MTNETKEITLINPFEGHGHLRRLATLMLKVIEYTIRQFSGMIVMPNTAVKELNLPHILDLKSLLEYRDELIGVLKKLGQEDNFIPCLTYYLSPLLTKHDLVYAWKNGLVTAVKSYPEGATTGSDMGLGSFNEVTETLEVMEKHKIPLLIHPETPKWKGEVVEDLKRESLFFNEEAGPLLEKFPGLKVSFEHISTKVARDFVLSKGANVVSTITPGFCSLDLRAVFNGITIDDDGNDFHYDLKKNGVYPSMVMRPLLKEIEDMRAIQEGLILQARSGLRKFGLGTDTAPHLTEHKHREGGSCGQFWAGNALEMYAWFFERMGIIDHLPTFACDIMPDFYGIKDILPKKIVTLKRIPQTIPKDYNGIIPPFAGLTIPWSAEYQN